jgi:hypothetical protein
MHSTGSRFRLKLHGSCLLPQRRLGAQEGAERLPVGLRRHVPVGAEGGPAVAQPLLIGVTVLRDDSRDALGVAHGEPEADRRAVVEHIDREAIQPDDLGQAVEEA